MGYNTAQIIKYKLESETPIQADNLKNPWGDTIPQKIWIISFKKAISKRSLKLSLKVLY